MAYPGYKEAITKDFDEVFEYLRTRLAIGGKLPGETVATAKRVHASAYSLITWKFRLRKIPKRGQIYLEEIASDAIQILPQVMFGFSKTAKLLMRGVIENTLRHIYFHDHPVEFTWANQAGKWYIAAAKMFEFLGSHPEFVLTEPKFDAIGQLSNLYSTLSAGVHGAAVRDLEMRTALKSIAFDQKRAEQDAELLHRCAAAANFLIAIYHHEQVGSFSVNNRRLIMRTLPLKARQVWKDHEPCPEFKAAKSAVQSG